jgi:hypothetical protein
MDSKRKSIKKCDPNQITAGKTDEDQAVAIARTVLRPTVQAAFTLRECSRLYGRAELSGLVNALTEQTRASGDGDLERAGAMLTVQAHTLDAIYNSLTRNAMNAELLNQFEANLKLALRAQSQCRATLDTLANMKKPSADLITHTNIAHGPQQINIHRPDDKPEEKQIPPNELLENKEHEPDKWLDTGAPQEAVEVDKDLEAVGEIDRAEVV